MISDLWNCCHTDHQKRKFAWKKVSGRSNVSIISA